MKEAGIVVHKLAAHVRSLGSLARKGEPDNGCLLLVGEAEVLGDIAKRFRDAVGAAPHEATAGQA